MNACGFVYSMAQNDQRKDDLFQVRLDAMRIRFLRHKDLFAIRTRKEWVKRYNKFCNALKLEV